MQDSYTTSILTETVNLEESPFSKCFYCQQQFCNLEPHVADHPNTKPFHCDECDVKLFKINHYINHITIHKVHSNSKPFNCPYCEEKFDNVAGFTEHVNTHPDAKPFKCPYCEESFDFENNLKGHKIIHEKMADTLMKCESCEDHFLIENFVNAKPGMKPFTCEVCLETFTDVIELCQHRAIIHPGYPYRCAQCRKANIRKDDKQEQMDSSDTENLSQALNILGHQENMGSINIIGEARKKNMGNTRTQNSGTNNKSESSYKNHLSNDNNNSPEDVKPDIIELNRDLENYSNNQNVCMEISPDFSSEKAHNGIISVNLASDLVPHGNEVEACNINMDINHYSDIFNRSAAADKMNSTQISLANEIRSNPFSKKSTQELEMSTTKSRSKRNTTGLNHTIDTSSSSTNVMYTDSSHNDTNEDGRPFPVLCVRVQPTLNNDQSEISPMILTDGPCSFRTGSMPTDLNSVRPAIKNASRLSANSERRLRNAPYQMTRVPTTADYQLATSTNTGNLGFSPLQRTAIANSDFQLSTKNTSFSNRGTNHNPMTVTSPRRCHECDIWKKMITDTVSKLATKEADCEIHSSRIQQLEQQLKESATQISTLNEALHSRSGDCQQYLQRIKQLEQQILQVMQQQIPQPPPPPPQQQLQRQTIVEINTSQSSEPPHCGSPITYEFGRPRAGFGLSKNVVEKYKMIDIGQGLYVHPDDLAVVLSKADGQKMVRKLMNIVFKKEDLEQGATLSPTGKGKLLDQRTVDVMLAWVLMNQSTMWSRGSLRQAINRKLTSYRCRSLKKKLEARDRKSVV